MLTKQDLKAIQTLLEKEVKKIVREEVENEAKHTREKVQTYMFDTKVELTTEIRQISSRIKDLEIQTNQIQKNIISLKKGQTKIQKQLKGITNFLDRDITYNRKSIRRLENKLDLEPLPFPKS